MLMNYHIGLLVLNSLCWSFWCGWYLVVVVLQAYYYYYYYYFWCKKAPQPWRSSVIKEICHQGARPVKHSGYYVCHLC